MKKRRARKRLVGVTLFGFVFILWGASLLYAASVFSSPRFQSSVTSVANKIVEDPEMQQFIQRYSKVKQDFESEKWATAVHGMPSVAVAWAVLFITAGIGLLQCSYLARWLIISLALWEVLDKSIVPLVTLVVTKEQVPSHLVGRLYTDLVWTGVWNGLILWYLLRPSVKAQFRPQRTRVTTSNK